MTTEEVEVILLVDDCHGIYVPRVFSEMYSDGHICDNDGKDLTESDKYLIREMYNMSPDDEHYWYTWDLVLSRVYMYKDLGNIRRIYALYQDGSLWAVSVDDLRELTEYELERFYERFM